IIRLSRITALRSRFKVVKQDPDDDIVINTALDGNAQYIVSGDKKILGLKQFSNIHMLTANEMIGLIDGK
ncbi:MAG: toxin-antitoxin system toxin component, PIN family protein, partial [Candidatus Micrarchaeota archaeon]|nr:toxin-antitoxin system toxin component, PIN family protein [Candidatus Micrarchaeota archaeon]